MYAIAFNTELPAGQAPEWVQLLPAGPRITGIDGREWLLTPEDKQALLAAFNKRGMPLPVDWEHATDKKGARGEEAPAAGWITNLELREGEVWSRVEWTPRAANQVANREYRFLSPVFYFTKQGGHVRQLESAGLTNTPNLHLRALNRRGCAIEEDEDMDLKALCSALGLADTAGLEQIVQAVHGLKADLDKAKNQPQPAALPKALCTALGLTDNATAEQAAAKAVELAKAANRQEPPAGDVDLVRFAPRPDLEKALNRATEAEGKLKKIEAEAHEARIVAAVDKAQGEGKFAPASREFYLAMCRKEGGLDEFEKFAATAPKVIADPVLPGKPRSDGVGGLDETDLAVCRSLGLDPADYAKNQEVQ